MWFNWVKVGMYALLLLLLLFNCGCCCCCFYMFVHVRANDWVKLKVRLLSAPGAQIVSMCTMCVYESLKSQAATSKINVVRTHTHSRMSRAHSLTPMWTHVAWLLLVVCTLLPGCWLYSPARNDRNVLKWDNCCLIGFTTIVVAWSFFFSLFCFLLKIICVCTLIFFFLYTYIFFCCCL